MPTPIEDLLAEIAAEYHAAERRLAAIQEQMREVEHAGMYPAVPTEKWKDDRYLYMVFTGLDADKLSLDAKGRIYIGKDPARIEEARRLASNRQQWEALQRSAQDLEWYLKERYKATKLQAQYARNWRGAVRQLGLDIAGQPGKESPNDDPYFDNLHERDGDYGVATARSSR